MLPRDALSSFMVWNTGGGFWWSAKGEVLKITKELCSDPQIQIRLDQTTLLPQYLKC